MTTKYYVQLFTTEDDADSHIRVWEVNERVFRKSEHHLAQGVGKPNMEAIVPAEKAQEIADFNEENSVVFE